MEDTVTPLAASTQPDPYSHWTTATTGQHRRPSVALSDSGSRTLGQLSLSSSSGMHSRKHSFATEVSVDSRRSSQSSNLSAGSGFTSSPEFGSWPQPPFDLSHSMHSMHSPQSAILPVTTSAPIQAHPQSFKPAPLQFSPYSFVNTPSLSASLSGSSAFSSLQGIAQQQRPLSASTSRPSTALSRHESPSNSMAQSPQTGASSATFSSSTSGTTPPESFETEQGRRIFADSAIDETMRHAEIGPLSSLSSSSSKKDSPYARSPEMRVSHKMAERKRRREMKDLFDELRESLPVERGQRSSKWETLTAAIEHIRNMESNAALERHRIMELESMVRRLTPSMGAYQGQQQQQQQGMHHMDARPPLLSTNQMPLGAPALPPASAASPGQYMQQSPPPQTDQAHQPFWTVPPTQQHHPHPSPAQVALTSLPPLQIPAVQTQ